MNLKRCKEPRFRKLENGYHSAEAMLKADLAWLKENQRSEYYEVVRNIKAMTFFTDRYLSRQLIGKM